MATKRRKSRKSSRSCKHGKLKRPVRTRRGGKRRCKKSKSKRRNRKRSKSKRRNRKRKSKRKRKRKNRQYRINSGSELDNPDQFKITYTNGDIDRYDNTSRRKMCEESAHLWEILNDIIFILNREDFSKPR